MDSKKYYLIRILKKIRILIFFNILCKKKINKNTYQIPVYKGVGLPNLFLGTDWLDNLLHIFFSGEMVRFVDVGTNVGQSLLKAKSYNKNIMYLGFEPNSTCISYINQLIRINKFSDCRVYNCALSDKTFKTALEKTNIDDVRASIIPDQRPSFFQDKEFVFAVQYDRFFSEIEIDFLKIDVEGAELDVLKGMVNSIKNSKPLITCEILDSHSPDTLEFTQQRASEIEKLLKSINYNILQISSKKQKGIESLKEIDSIQIKQWTVESYNTNDYIFYPKERESEVLNKLSHFFI